MIHELRTYTIRTEYGGVRELERRFRNGIDVRLKYSALGGFFHTQAGPLSQVVHIWPYENLRDRAESRAAANRDESERWPPGIAELFERQEVEILLPAPFMQALEPRELGSVWELSWVDYRPRAVAESLAAYAGALPGRQEHYPVVGCWTVMTGPAGGRIYVLAPYKDFDHRNEVAAAVEGTWPPTADLDPVARGSKLLEPAKFSPLR